MRSRKHYTADQLQELVNDLHNYGLAFVAQFQRKSRTLKVVTPVKSYFYPCDESIKEVIVYTQNQLIFKLNQNVK